MVFDFSDSLLPWGSPCASLRSESCVVSHNWAGDSLSVASLSSDSECQCEALLRSAATCFFNHPLAMLTPHSSALSQPNITLSGVHITHLYAFYNSIIGGSPNLSINDSYFSHISICGSLLSSYNAFPLNASSTYSKIQHMFSPSQPPNTSPSIIINNS